MLGKNKCKILKQIRQKIADENDIPYVTRECTYQGECKGTCPKCEAELRYLEQELAKRQALGKGVAVAALAASLTFASGCVSSALAGDVADDPATATKPTDEQIDVLEGEVAETEILEGYIATETTAAPYDNIEGEPEELLGDVAYESDPCPTDDYPGATETTPVETLPVAPESTASDAG